MFFIWSWSYKFSVSVFSLSICIFLLLSFCISSCLCEDHTDVCFLYNTRTLSSLSSLCSSASFPNISFFLYTYVYIFLQLFLSFFALPFALNFIIFICITNLLISFSNCSPLFLSLSLLQLTSLTLAQFLLCLPSISPKQLEAIRQRT